MSTDYRTRLSTLIGWYQVRFAEGFTRFVFVKTTGRNCFVSVVRVVAAGGIPIFLIWHGLLPLSPEGLSRFYAEDTFHQGESLVVSRRTHLIAALQPKHYEH